MTSQYNPGDNFYITSKQGYRTLRGNPDYHGGWDFAASSGVLAIPAAAAGDVIYTGYNQSFGNTVILKHIGSDGNPFYTLYAHMKDGSDMPELGQHVAQGESVGIEGGTGTAAKGAVHLHFQILKGSTPVRESGEGGSLGFSYKSDHKKGIDWSENPGTFDNWPAGGPYGASTSPTIPKVFDLLAAGVPIDGFICPTVGDIGFIGEFAGLMNAASNTFTPRRVIADPLTLDRNGDGVLSTIAVGTGAHFDFGGDGFAEATGWIAPSEELVVRDINGNGTIDSGAELFGDATLLPNGTYAADGFKAIAPLDSNGDGIVDRNDTHWGELQVWRDANADGITDAGELVSTEVAGVESISTTHAMNRAPTADAQGNFLAGTGTFKKSDGSRGVAGTFLFTRDLLDARPMEYLELSEEINALPEIVAFGSVHSLRQAMARDPGLVAAVTTLSQSADYSNLRKKFDSLLLRWTHSDAEVEGSRGSFIDAGKLAVLEKFSGQRFIDAGHSHIPSDLGANSLNKAYELLANKLYEQFIAQAQLRPVWDKVFLRGEPGTASASPDFSKAIPAMKALLGDAPSPILQLLSDFVKGAKGFGLDTSISFASFRDAFANSPHGYDLLIDKALAGQVVPLGSDTADRLVGLKDTSNLIYGFAGDDSLTGGSGADVLKGGAGDDTLGEYVYWGNADSGYAPNGLASSYVAPTAGNTYEGGTGSDTMYGTSMSDLYLFNRGDGADIIHEAEVSGQPAGQIDVLRFGQGIHPDEVQVGRNGTDLVLSVGVTGDRVTIKGWYAHVPTALNHIERVEFSDGVVWSAPDLTTRGTQVCGTAGNDSLTGLANISNTLYGLEGNDHLKAGSAGDLLEGGAGNDSLTGGAGADVLKGGAGDDTLGYSVYWGNSDSGYSPTGASSYVAPTAGNTYEGGTGSDTMYGTSMSDLYLFNRGDGADIIHEAEVSGQPAGQVDVLRFGPNITASDLETLRVGADLRIKLKNTTDQITVRNWHTVVGSTANQIEQFAFANGVVLSAEQLVTKDIPLIGTEGSDTLTGQLAGSQIIGGLGNDQLISGSDSDTFVFNSGDGADTVINTTGNMGPGDVIKFGPGITPASIAVRREGVNLVLSNAATSDAITLQDWYLNGTANRFESVQFADGTKWSAAELTAQGLVVSGTAGNDALQGLTGHVSTLSGGAGNDTLTAGNLGDTLNGDAGNDQLIGGAGSDVLNGGAGDDTLGQAAAQDLGANTYNGGTGNDLSYGTAAGDVYLFNAGDGQDNILEAGAASPVDILRFGEGILASNTVASKSNAGLVLSFAGSTDSVTIKDWFQPEVPSTRQIERFEFSDGTVWTAEQLVAQGYVLQGTSGNDTLTGLNGNDTLKPQSGTDVLDGGAGIDTADFSGETANLTVSLAVATAQDTGVGAKTFLNIENLVGGSGNDLLTGSTGDNVLDGGAGNDTLNGGGAADTLIGGDGDDVLNGGTGLNTLIGGEGDDTYVVTQATDVVVETGTSVQDTVNVRFDYTLTEGVEVARAQGAIGRITGNELNNVFRDATDATASTRFEGLAGDDLFLLNGVGADVVDGGSGLDTVDLARATAGLTLNTNLTSAQSVGEGQITFLNVENFILGSGNDVITGSDANNTFEGGSGNDTLNGNGGDDYLIGGAGDDILNGGTGLNTLEGGQGDDTYFFGVSTDVIVETGSSTNDAINAVVDCTMAEGVEIGRAQAGINRLTGNGLNNTLRDATALNTDTLFEGGDGNDVFFLNGGGNDTVDGGAGTDVLNLTFGSFSVKPGVDLEFGSNVLVYEGGTLTFKSIEQINFGVGADDIKIDGATNGLRILYSGDTSTSNSVNHGHFRNGTGWFIGGSAGREDVTLENLGGSAYDSRGGDDVYRVVGKTVVAIADYFWRSSDNMFFNGGQDLVSLETESSLANLTYTRSADGTLEIRSTSGMRTTLLATNDMGTHALERIAMPLLGLNVTVDEFLQAVDGAKLAPVALAGSTAADALNGQTYRSNELQGLAGDDILNGGALDDVLSGDAGNDQLTGGAGSDVLKGGAGYDRLSGGSGSDVYLFNAGDWGDTITESPEIAGNAGTGDTLIFGEGLTSLQWAVSRYGTDLLLRRTGTPDAITVKEWYNQEGSTAGQIESVLLSDGTLAWTARQLTELGLVVQGTSGDDLLTGIFNYSDTLKGGDGNDLLYGRAGDDVLEGGAGNDYLDGGVGADVLRGGEGNDTLGGPELSRGYLDANGVYRGPGAGDSYEGGAGNDLLIGTTHADVYLFNLGDGSDTISEIEVNGAPLNQVDQIKFGAAINPADIYVTRNGTALQLKHINNSDSITINSWYTTQGSTANQIESVVFSNGVLWTASDLTTRGLTTYGTAGSDSLAGVGDYANVLDGKDGDDTIAGGLGNDLIWGGAGADTLFGYQGDDRLYGGDGNDYLDGGPGYDFLDGGGGDDRMYGSHENDQLWGSTGNDDIHGGTGNDLLMGESGNDTLYGDSGSNTLNGGVGDDIFISAGTDHLWGGGGYDTYRLMAGTGNHVVHEDIDGGIVDFSNYVDANLALTVYALSSDQLCVRADGGETNIIVGWANSNILLTAGTRVWTATEVNAQLAANSSFKLFGS